MVEVGLYPLSRRDRAAMELALEELRREDFVYRCGNVLAYGGRISLDLIEEVTGAWVRSRLLRARLALLLRCLLRVDRGDFGATVWVGCNCVCDGDNGGWVPAPVRPLWADAPPHEVSR
jgi:hypothetical protein